MVLKATGPALSPSMAGRVLRDLFRCSPEVDDCVVSGELSGDSGYFQFGPGVICYGQYSAGRPMKSTGDPLPDARADVRINGRAVYLPFNPAQVIENL